jgi:hypothetical protein
MLFDISIRRLEKWVLLVGSLYREPEELWPQRLQAGNAERRLVEPVSAQSVINNDTAAEMSVAPPADRVGADHFAVRPPGFSGEPAAEELDDGLPDRG